jgi:hypothetical protein
MAVKKFLQNGAGGGIDAEFVQADYSDLTGTPTIPSAASKADEQTGTSTTVYTSPGQQQSHDSAAKAWVSFTGATGAILASYNVSGVVRNSAGNYTVSFTTAFSSAHYVCFGSSDLAATSNIVLNNTKAAGSVSIRAQNTANGTQGDPTTVDVVCFGRQ